MLKRQEEMRECTFRPKLVKRMPSPRPASPRPQPRNFEAAVERMRSAHQQRVARKQEDERIPCGENYERLRKLGAQPFACAFSKKPRDRRELLMYIDVTVQRGRTGRIGLHEGDDVHKVSRNFAKVWQLAPGTSRQLEGMLQKAYAGVQSAALSQNADLGGAQAKKASPKRGTAAEEVRGPTRIPSVPQGAELNRILQAEPEEKEAVPIQLRDHQRHALRLCLDAWRRALRTPTRYLEPRDKEGV